MRNLLLEKMALAIQKYEGWQPGSRSYRNNNPGNLRTSIFEIKKVAGFAYFRSYRQGFAALLFDILCKCSGHTATNLRPSSTLYNFFEVYAPIKDGNRPRHYAEFVAQQMGVSPTITLLQIIANQPSKPSLVNQTPQPAWDKYQRIKLPKGKTLTHIAQEYLGNASRWKEIIVVRYGRPVTESEARKLQINEDLLVPRR